VAALCGCVVAAALARTQLALSGALDFDGLPSAGSGAVGEESGAEPGTSMVLGGGGGEAQLGAAAAVLFLAYLLWLGQLTLQQAARAPQDRLRASPWLLRRGAPFRIWQAPELSALPPGERLSAALTLTAVSDRRPNPSTCPCPASEAPPMGVERLRRACVWFARQVTTALSGVAVCMIGPEEWYPAELLIAAALATAYILAATFLHEQLPPEGEQRAREKERDELPLLPYYNGTDPPA
jgi:hypothetical protein